MPSLRDSGKIVGRSASIRQIARQCNLSFPLSLRKFIRTPGCPFSRCNRLHIKVLTEPTLPLTIETMLNRMREVYSTAGIGIEVVSRENLTPAVLGNANFNDLNSLDVGRCRGSTTSNEQNRLFQNQNNIPAGQRNNEIVIYFVQSAIMTYPDGSIGTVNGCSTHPSGQPGAVLTKIATEWTLAHEVGHILGLKHISGEHQGCPDSDPECCNTPDFTRLMTGCGTDYITGTPTIDQSEINKMIVSPLTRQCRGD